MKEKGKRQKLKKLLSISKDRNKGEWSTMRGVVTTS